MFCLKREIISFSSFKYNSDEQADKWIEYSCPFMVLCVIISIMFSSVLSFGSLRFFTNVSATLRMALTLSASQFIFAFPSLFFAPFFFKGVKAAKKLGLIKWKFSYFIEALTWEAVLIIPLLALAAAVYIISSYFGYNFTSPLMDFLKSANGYGVGLTFVFAVFVAPIVEEIAFRRVLFVFTARMFGEFSAAILTSLAFAFMHGGVVQVLPLFILSLVLQRLYLKHGTLFPSILLHSAHNFITMILFMMIFWNK